jgi:hypothetical protein
MTGQKIVSLNQRFEMLMSGKRKTDKRKIEILIFTKL